MPIIWSKIKTFKHIIGFGIITSIFVEVIQIFIGRSFDVDDVILNAFGIVLGFLPFKITLIIQDMKYKNSL